MPEPLGTTMAAVPWQAGYGSGAETAGICSSPGQAGEGTCTLPGWRAGSDLGYFIAVNGQEPAECFAGAVDDLSVGE